MTYKLAIIMYLMTAYHFQDIKEDASKEISEKEDASEGTSEIEKPDEDYKIGDLSKDDLEEIAELTFFKQINTVKSKSMIKSLVDFGGCKYECRIRKCRLRFYCLIRTIYCLLNKFRSILPCLSGLSCSEKKDILMYTLNNYLWGSNRRVATLVKGIFSNIISGWC